MSTLGFFRASTVTRFHPQNLIGPLSTLLALTKDFLRGIFNFFLKVLNMICYRKRALKELLILAVLAQSLATETSENILHHGHSKKSEGVGTSSPPVAKESGPDLEHVYITGNPQDSASYSRRLKQREDTQQNTEDFNCSLSETEIEAIYDLRTRVWTLNESLLEQNVDIIQAAINCSSANDVILLITNATLQPSDTIVISWNLTLSADPGGSLLQDGVIVEANSKVRFTCPREGDLLSIRARNVTVANVVFAECSNASSIVSLKIGCENRDEISELLLQNVEFRDNVFFGGEWIIESVNPNCTHVSLQNVSVVRNQCGRTGCISLASVNTLTDVSLKGNTAAASDTVSQGVFHSSVGSNTTATRISATRNQIRIFNVVNGTLFILDSLFRENRVSDTNSLYLSEGGSILLANQSSVTIFYCSIENNSASNGGALFSIASHINMRYCLFEENSATRRHGGAISARDGSFVALMRTNFFSNTARDGGACYFDQTNVTMTDLAFQSNAAVNGDGGAVYNLGGEIIGKNLNFSDNRATSRGGALHCEYTPRVVLSNTQFHNNHGSYGGAICVFNSGLELRSSCTFTMNHGIHDGGSIYQQKSRALMNSCYFHSNSADTGGSMWLGQGSHCNIENSSFTNETAVFNGGAIHLSQASRMNVSFSLFSRNEARKSGGALFSSESSNSTISNCSFEDNNATLRGGAISAQSDSLISISNTRIHGNVAEEGGGLNVGNATYALFGCNLTQNSANSSGGAIYGIRGVLTIRGGKLSSNKASKGAGIDLSRMDDTEIDSALFEHNHANGCGGALQTEDGHAITHISSCNFSTNNAINGSALFLRNLTARISSSRFEGNNATVFGAGIYLTESSLTMRRSVLLSNRARSCAGICVHSNSILRGKAITLRNNVALEDGGGIGVESLSRCLCRSCEFRNNSAIRGAGLYADTEDPMRSEDQFQNYTPIVAQLQDSIFEGNVASEYGGGILLRQPQTTNINCTNLSTACGRIILLNVSFVDNIVTRYGSAILTTDPAGVLTSCSYSKHERDFIGRELLESLVFVSPERLCPSWKGNKVIERVEGVIGTYGMVWNFSTAFENEAKVVHDEEHGFVLENVKSGVELPLIHVSLLDAYGNGPIPTEQYSFQVEVSSPDKYFQGILTSTITGGNGSLLCIRGLKPPGNYTLKIVPNINTVSPTTLLINIRQCQIGEGLAARGLLCEECNALSYNFNPSTGMCTACPNGATCETRYIVPKDGYWHRGPCDARLMRCLSEEVCQYNNRQETLQNLTQDFNDCKINRDLLVSYGEALCRTGYRGPLCGSCQQGYGPSLGVRCSICPHTIWSLLRILFYIFYLLVLAFFTVRGGLSTSPRIRTQSTRPAMQRNVIRNSTRSAAMNIQMIEITRDGYIPLEVTDANLHMSDSDEDTQDVRNLELTGWMTSEILKILINFLQTTAVYAIVNVQWTVATLSMFKVAEYVGVLTTTVLSPIDCIIGGSSSAVRSIWRTAIGLLMPAAFMGLLVMFWGYATFSAKEGVVLFWKRALSCFIAVTYLSYVSLTKLAVGVFYCIDVFDSEDPFSDFSTLRWAVDTSILCYGKDHTPLVVIGVVMLIVMTLFFPLISAFIIVKNKAQLDNQQSWVFETMGFLYRAFKKRFIFWESIAMLRKACLSIIVLFSYSLGNHLQGLFAQLVLVLSLCAHAKCLPYKEEFHRLNSYEFASLSVSSLTFILGQFFGDERSGHFRLIISFLIISMDVLFVLVLVSVLVLCGIEHIREVLKLEGVLLDDDARAWKVIKVYAVSKIRRLFRPAD